MAIIGLIGLALLIVFTGGLLAGAFGVLKLSSLALATVLSSLAAELVLAATAFLAVALLAPAVAAYAGGGWAAGRLGLAGLGGRSAALGAGLLILVALRTLPVLGGLVWLLAAVAGLGALSVWCFERWTARKTRLTQTRGV
jgi:hypothetical protein